jgi:hypothetical protein
MSKLQMNPPLGGGVPSRLCVKAQHVARPPTPWRWVIYEEGESKPLRCSTRLYPSAEEAWAVGHTMIARLPRHVLQTPTASQGDAAPGRDTQSG